MVSHTALVGSPWRGMLADVLHIVDLIRQKHVFGRLSLRNTERLSILHLYFRAGRLVHLAGNRGDIATILADLREWNTGFLRFERGVMSPKVTLHHGQEKLVMDALTYLQRRGVIVTSSQSHVIDGSVVDSTETRQLITPWEWRVLLEVIYSVSQTLSHLVGPVEAHRALQHMLHECATTLPICSSLQITINGRLRTTDRSLLDRVSREELLAGFTALLSRCQQFCVPLVGEKQARQFMLQALQSVCAIQLNLQ